MDNTGFIAWEKAVVKVIGDADVFSLEHRFLNSACFAGSFGGLFATAINLFLHLSIWLTAVTFVYSMALLIMYILSRFRKQYRHLVWILIILSCGMLSVVWILNSGSNGSGMFLYLIALLIFTILLENGRKILAVLIVLLNVAALLGLEYIRPDWIAAYQTPSDRLYDIYFTFFFCVLIMFFSLLAIVKNYYDERSKADQEKDLLKVRNDTMERELDIARRIQSKLIPSFSPLKEISFYYRPMDKLGGDFYDFLRLPVGDRTGIFLSDVSGHGIPAAFVTSLLKTNLMRLEKYWGDPDTLLAFLNEALLYFELDQFVTVFYAIYDKENLKLVYSNAGHSIPYLVRGGKAEKLQTNRGGAPIGIFQNAYLEQHGLRYSNQSVSLERGDKVFLYTDGIAEAMPQCEPGNESAPECFEKRLLRDILVQNSGLSGEELLETVATELSGFHGSRDFDDDVCMICLDVR